MKNRLNLQKVNSQGPLTTITKQPAADQSPLPQHAPQRTLHLCNKLACTRRKGQPNIYDSLAVLLSKGLHMPFTELFPSFLVFLVLLVVLTC